MKLEYVIIRVSVNYIRLLRVLSQWPLRQVLSPCFQTRFVEYDNTSLSVIKIENHNEYEFKIRKIVLYCDSDIAIVRTK